MNTNLWLAQNFNYNEIWQSLSFGEVFSCWKGGGFVVKLVAAKIIRQHMLFLYIIISKIIISEIKYMIAQVHENHDKWSNVTPVQYFCSVFDLQIF